MLWSSPAFPRELYEFYRGVRPSAMGNAFTAIADDSDALYYNPAGLASNAQMKFHLLNPKIDISKDDYTLYQEVSGENAGLNAETIEKFFGKNIFVSASVAPMIELPFLTVAYLYKAEMHMISRNLSYPQIEARYLIDRGVMAGSGLEFKGVSKRQYVRVGAAVKWITRQGFDGVIPLSTLASADRSALKDLSKGPAAGWGLDLGMQYSIPMSKLSDLVLGSAWHDIGGTQFGGREYADRPPSIPSNLTAGVAWTQILGSNRKSPVSFKLTGEMRHLNETGKDWRLKTHVGSELILRNLGLQLGWNQDDYTAGATFEFLFLKLAAATYSVENQSVAFMNRERRYTFQVQITLDGGGETLSATDEDRRKYPRKYE